MKMQQFYKDDKICGNAPYIIGICGGTGSGKTSFSKKLKSSMKDEPVSILKMEHFMKQRPISKSSAEEWSSDIPEAIDFDLFHISILKLKGGSSVKLPIHSTAMNGGCHEATVVDTSRVIIVEGFLIFYDKRIRNLLDLRIFLNPDSDVCSSHSIKGGMVDRKEPLEVHLLTDVKHVKRSFELHVEPLKLYADAIIPYWKSDSAFHLIYENIRGRLQSTYVLNAQDNMYVLPQTPQIQQLLTRLRDVNTKRSDFVFYTNRISHLLVEFALGFLPFSYNSVTTPTGENFDGLSGIPMDDLCIVSLIRGGECMERGALAVCKNVSVGKLMLKYKNTDRVEWDGTHDDNPLLLYSKLPERIHKQHPLLFDPVIGRGYSSEAAILELKKKGVPECNICCISIICYRDGISRLCRMFPNVRFITANVDERLSEEGYVLPGAGDFACRYFGC